LKKFFIEQNSKNYNSNTNFSIFKKIEKGDVGK
jgi:hypothetical protein